MARSQFENLQVYQLAEKLADEIWDVASEWRVIARDTLGKQMIRAADSIGANIAEGAGRGLGADNRRFIRVARGSLHETRHWLRRAFKRRLLTREQINRLTPLVDELSPRLNAYLTALSRGNSKAKD
jgi:four helix bundle protein